METGIKDLWQKNVASSLRFRSIRYAIYHRPIHSPVRGALRTRINADQKQY